MHNDCSDVIKVETYESGVFGISVSHDLSLCINRSLFTSIEDFWFDNACLQLMLITFFSVSSLI